MSAIALNISVFLAVSTVGVSLLLLIVSLLAYHRIGHPRLAIVGGAFLVLGVKGGFSAYRTVVQRETLLLETGLDFLVLALLYGSVAKR